MVALSGVMGLVLLLRFPRAAMLAWILATETAPDGWLDNMIGGNEVVTGALKTAGIALVLALGLNYGWRRDRYNPALAFAVMFWVGIVHGLYPSLTLLGSLRSLAGSAAPFLFGFVQLPETIAADIKRAVLWGPVFAVAFSLTLALLGVDHLYALEAGALRLGGAGQPPFLAGFALIGIYAGLLETLAAERRGANAAICVNFVILLATGARLPLALALLVTVAVLAARRRIMALAFLGALFFLAILFSGALGFVRVVGLAGIGEAADLSNRNLVWPYFLAAFASSPWLGWGVGAGKVIIPVTSRLSALLGTNAAHDEYLRIGAEGGVLGLALLLAAMLAWVRAGTAHLSTPQRRYLWLVLAAFAVHSMTDNTLIAATGSVMFLWICAVFAGMRPAPAGMPEAAAPA